MGGRTGREKNKMSLRLKLCVGFERFGVENSSWIISLPELDNLDGFMARRRRYCLLYLHIENRRLPLLAKATP